MAKPTVRKRAVLLDFGTGAALLLSAVLLVGCHPKSPRSARSRQPDTNQAIKVSSGSPEAGYVSSTSYALRTGEDNFQLTLLMPIRADFAPVLRFSVSGPNSSCAQRAAAADFAVLQTLFHTVLAKRSAQPTYTLYTCYHELDDRLPALAAHAPGWQDLNRGHPSLKAQYQALAGLINSSQALSELSKSLGTDHYQVHIASQDLEVIWAKAIDLRGEQRRLLPASTPPDQVLPSSMGKTFILTRENTD